jgi:hypothetical protein
VIEGFDLFDSQSVSFNNFTGSNNMSPSYCSIIMTTDQGYLPNMDFSTFASDITGNTEIYVNMWIYDTSYLNISVNSVNNAHPQLFNNFHFYSGLDNQLFDIWESYRGGHWQLWATTRDILTGEDALKGYSTGMIKCSPNPFKDETRIEYFSGKAGLVAVDIYDLPGRRIKTLITMSEGQGMHSVTWDRKDDSGIVVPAGIYVCTLKTADKFYNCKIICR